MKKIFIASIMTAASLWASTAQAQNVLSDLLSGMANAAAQSATTQTNNAGKQGSSSTTSSNVMGAVLNNVVSNTASNSETGNLISNLIASVAGDLTTTSASVVSTWKYSAPSVQFESQDYLSQAGGVAIAEKLEDKLASIYKLVSIKPGKMVFTFDANGGMTYSVGMVQRQGTYTFDNATKTMMLTTASGTSFKCYVTVSGNNMLLTFDGDKFLNFMKTLGSRFSLLNTASSIAGRYEGMKIGFKFEK